MRKFCETEDREVAGDDIGKGYQLTKELVIPVSDDELSNLPLPTAKAIEIEAFVPLQLVDPLRIGEGYYLQPSGQVAAKLPSGGRWLGDVFLAVLGRSCTSAGRRGTIDGRVWLWRAWL